jgi:hypothetical protein
VCAPLITGGSYRTKESLTSLFFNVNGAAHDTDNNKFHDEKTPQPTNGQRCDRLTEENISNIVEGKNWS